ncbi:TPA: conjugal transfer protein TraM [Campylobacter jejuni]|uniref:conjugal transfer protein TraM n=1 Tax=Campylobacter sp. CNRCH_2016_3089 TaxID=2911609 RepID=UPI0021E698D5|nr:conjugal transfer protein TraM [Campylobacter sp. CNRCH_2016_3089]MCV3433331.1 conjugal transfer protein TraM [Campylobacter lari]MCV3509218.1 conjugal transfer protein TraM [Campylobacter sp. CNRCH_2016_3089]
MNKKELIDEIAKKHHIILDENDPIFAVVSANEIIFESFIKQIDTLFLKQKSDLETFKVNIINDIKDYNNNSQENLKAIINEINTNINIKSEIKQDNNSNNSKKINLNYLLIFFAGQIIFLLIGLIIGITI